MLTLALAAALSAPAQAEAEILFRTAGPVLVFVDGDQAPITGSLKMRARDLEPGWHDVRVQGVFGKTLYEGEIDLDDWTITHAEWANGELRVNRIDRINRVVGEEEEPEDAEEEAEEEPEEVEEVAAVEEEPPLEEEIPIEPAPPVEPAIEEEPQPADVDEMPVAAAPIVEEVPLPLAAAADPQSSMLTIDATDGMKVQLVNGDSTLFLWVQDGTFIVADGTGVTVTFGTENTPNDTVEPDEPRDQILADEAQPPVSALALPHGR